MVDYRTLTRDGRDFSRDWGFWDDTCVDLGVGTTDVERYFSVGASAHRWRPRGPPSERSGPFPGRRTKDTTCPVSLCRSSQTPKPFTFSKLLPVLPKPRDKTSRFSSHFVPTNKSGIYYPYDRRRVVGCATPVHESVATREEEGPRSWRGTHTSLEGEVGRRR